MLMFSTAVVFVWRVSEHPEVRPVEVVEAGHGGRVQGREVAGRQLIRAAAAADKDRGNNTGWILTIAICMLPNLTQLSNCEVFFRDLRN